MKSISVPTGRGPRITNMKRTAVLFLAAVSFLFLGAQDNKTVNGLAIASVKTVKDLAITSVKTINGLDNTAGGGGALAFVEEQHNNWFGGSGTTEQLTITVASGNLLVLGVGWVNTQDIS